MDGKAEKLVGGDISPLMFSLSSRKHFNIGCGLPRRVRGALRTGFGVNGQW